MDRPADLVEQATAMGATFELTTNGVKVSRREGPLPSDLLEELRRYKDDIRRELAKCHYDDVYSHPDQRENELMELVRAVKRDGYVLLWSNVLNDLVAFHRDDVDRAAIPAEFVPYSDNELRHIYGEDKPDMTEHTIRVLHKAKVLGGKITGSYKDDEVRDDKAE